MCLIWKYLMLWSYYDFDCPLTQIQCPEITHKDTYHFVQVSFKNWSGGVGGLPIFIELFMWLAVFFVNQLTYTDRCTQCTHVHYVTFCTNSCFVHYARIGRLVLAYGEICVNFYHVFYYVFLPTGYWWTELIFRIITFALIQFFFILLFYENNNYSSRKWYKYFCCYY